MQIGAIREVGERIRRRRTDRGLSQAELADLADLDRLYLSRLERGLQNPSLLVLFRLGLELGVGLSKLVDGVVLDADEIRAVKRLSRGPGSRATDAGAAED